MSPILSQVLVATPSENVNKVSLGTALFGVVCVKVAERYASGVPTITKMFVVLLTVPVDASSKRIPGADPELVPLKVFTTEVMVDPVPNRVMMNLDPLCRNGPPGMNLCPTSVPSPELRNSTGLVVGVTGKNAASRPETLKNCT